MKRDITNFPAKDVQGLKSESFVPSIHPYGYPHHGYPHHSKQFGGGHKQMMGFVTWILVVALLVALIRLVWRKGDKA